MNKPARIILTFLAWFVIAYLIVGYITNAIFTQIDWVEGATIWDRLREFYIRTFSSNIIPALIIAVIPASIVAFINRIQ